MPASPPISLLNVVVSVLVAAGIAALAWRLRLLTSRGAVAATIVGGCAMAAGWGWVVALLLFFGTSSALSHIGATTKLARAGDRIEKTGARDARQVIANGGAFAAGAVIHAFIPGPLWASAALGALASATADTWATEIGMLAEAAPRSVTTFKRLSVGASGGVTMIGTLAGMSGAVMIAVAALLITRSAPTTIAVVFGGVAGMFVDSLLGAALQAVRRCERCGTLTERRVHGCGTPTRMERGLSWLDNDGVNGISTVAGALTSFLIVANA